jgi:hypothetical protein
MADQAQPVVVVIQRFLATYVADCVVEEQHEDNLQITDHPVEQGSVVSDHAYKLPAELTLRYIWSMGSSQNTGGSQNFLRSMYQAMLLLQSNPTAPQGQRVSLFSVATGKRTYENMVLRGIDCTTDDKRENILELTLRCKEIIFAVTTTTSITSASQQQQPNKTAPVLNSGQQNLLPASNWNSTASVAQKGVL